MYQPISTNALLELLILNSPNGFQVSRRHGIMNSTKGVFLKMNQVYIFDISENFTFKKDDGKSFEDFKIEYRNCQWFIEESIS